jgi:uncharacterized protein (DUF433 family)
MPQAHTAEHTRRRHLATPHPGVARTERDLVLAGTRITLYAIYDDLISPYHRFTTEELLDLDPSITREQLQAALDYIDEQKEEFAGEYRAVLEQAEAQRR